MHNIYLNSGNKGLSFESFQTEMISICNKHRKENRALAFAFILYDLRNPHVKKVLNDKDYWLALNEISGKYLSIFSLIFDEIKTETQDVESKRVVRYMNPVFSEKNLSEANENLLKTYFTNIERILPAILFFQVDNNEIIDTLLIELKEEKIELAFLELRDYIKSSVEALERIKPEFRNNLNEIFDNLERNVGSTSFYKGIRRMYKNFGPIASFVASLSTLL